MASLEDNWKEDEHIGDYPVEGEGHIKSWKHKILEVEVSVVQQHKGMLMYHRVYVVEPEDEDAVQDRDIAQVSEDMRSSNAAIEEAKHWMRRNPMAGYKGDIHCKDCGKKVGLEINNEDFIICTNCDHYEKIEEESEHFEVVKEGGKQPYRVEA